MDRVRVELLDPRHGAPEKEVLARSGPKPNPKGGTDNHTPRLATGNRSPLAKSQFVSCVLAANPIRLFPLRSLVSKNRRQRTHVVRGSVFIPLPIWGRIEIPSPRELKLCHVYVGLV